MTNVKLPAKQWVDLYAGSGLSVGIQITALNLTPNDVRLCSTAGEPTGTTDHVPLLFGRGKGINQAGDAGAWAMCVGGGGVDILEVIT